MCGIYGFIGFKDNKLLEEMGHTLSHRGPDDQQYFQEESINLGYRRLAIIDLQGSFQPLYNEDKSLALVYNGEVYNFRELKNKLTDKGHRFYTEGDGEAIVHWYEENGSSGFAQLNGMFGLAIYDRKIRKIILARDHFGIKPLFYYAEGKKLIFSSEIKAILVALRKLKIPIQPNGETIQKYLLTRKHDDNQETFFNDIKRLPPSSFLEWDLNTSHYQVQRYWSFPTGLEDKNITFEDAKNKFLELFRNSVKLRLISEVPVGTALSGGLDSSAVVRMINSLVKNEQKTKNSQLFKTLGERQKTFSAVFPGEANNEKFYIDEVVNQTRVDNYEIRPQREQMWQDLDKLIYYQDEPMISSGPYAQWKVMELAHHKGIKVLLDGQGADEMLAGYIPYHFIYLKELWREKKYFRLLQEALSARDVFWPFIKERALILLGIKKGFKISELFRFPDSLLINSHQAATQDSVLNKRLEEDIFKNSLPALLRYEDRNSMAFSIEARVPFLDPRLVEFVASLPANFKIRNGWNKWVMREAFKDLLPEKIRNRRWKVGFTTPEIAWMRKSAREINTIINSESFRNRSYFNSAKIRERFKEFLEGKNEESLVFWRIINLELWMRIFIDK